MSEPLPRPLPGGPLAIDLLNTTWRPGDDAVEWLDDPAAVVAFVASHGVELAADDVDRARAALVEARSLVGRLLRPAPGPIADDVVAEVNRALATAVPWARPIDDGLELMVIDPDGARTVATAAVVNAVELLGDRPDRVRSCEHEDCTLWFYDTSKAGRRRWCSMERCGNRAKVRRHYERSRRDPEA